MITIIADDRETNGANPFFDKFIITNNAKYSKQSIKNGGGDIKLCINRVTTGDYNIIINCNKEKSIVAMIIERKTWKDLAASFKDGRSETQHKEMLSVQQRTGCILTYILEGKICYDKDYKVNRIPFANLDAKRRHLSLRGHSVLQTKDQEHTAEMIVNLARDIWRMFQMGELQFNPKLIYEQHDSQKKINTNLTNLQILTYESYKRELLILNIKYAHLGNKLINHNTNSIEDKTDKNNMTVISGELKITDDIDEIEAAIEKSENIENINDIHDVELVTNLALLNIHSDETIIPAILTERKIKPNSDIIERMWVAIPGVSVKSAPILINNYKISDLVTANDVQMLKLIKDISELKYPTGRRFGDELANKIMKLSYNGKGITRLDDLKNICIGILAEIPGVTRETAKAILDKYTLRQICLGEVNEDDLANIYKSSNRKLGIKTALKIIELLL